jgi:hypothetical protein
MSLEQNSGWRPRQSTVACLISALTAAACALALVLWLPSATFAQASRSRSDTHVYLFRGFMNVFSLGMDGLGSELERRGIPASVYNHLMWSAVADEAARNYKSGRTRTIIAVGHSIGADAVASFVERLGNQGVPVALAVALDDGYSITLTSGRVGKFVNLYISGGALGGGIYARGQRFSGQLINIDLAKDPSFRRLTDLGHMNIDKTPAVQRLVMAYINEAVGRGGPAQPSSSGKVGSGAVASPAETEAPASTSASPDQKAAGYQAAEPN